MKSIDEALSQEIYATMGELEALVAQLDQPIAVKQGGSILPSLVLVVIGREATEFTAATHDLMDKWFPVERQRQFERTRVGTPDGPAPTPGAKD